MRNFFAICLLFVTQYLIAQGTAKEFINEGVALHDKGEYNNALLQYDQALRLEPANYMAMYEKSYSLMALKRYDDATDLLKKVLKDSKDPDIRKLCYVNYGSILDYQGEGKKSIKIYKEAIKEFPDEYLLYFNKGVTEQGMNETEDAVESFKDALRKNPYHASSHNALGRLVAGESRISGVLSMVSFLVIEPTSQRGKQNMELLNKLLMKGIEKKDDKNTVITIDAGLLDKKNKPKEDDFSSAEFMLSLMSANDKVADSLGAKTDADRLSYRFQLLIGMLDKEDKKDKGFFKTFYVPMYAEMKEKNHVTTACYIALASSGKDDINQWLKDHKTEVENFYKWFKGYIW
jgi:tetratricopeptide (TPR) repeat protein